MSDAAKKLQDILKEIETIKADGGAVTPEVMRPSGYDD